MAWKGWETVRVDDRQALVTEDTRRMKRDDGPPKPSKHKNVRVTFAGQTFDSKREANRWLMLTGAQARGEITDLRRQVNFDLTAIERNHPERGFQRVAFYVADFTYYEGGKFVVEDAKGMKTDVYKIKKRWVKAEYGIEIRET
jgi:hypothetical protein